METEFLQINYHNEQIFLAHDYMEHNFDTPLIVLSPAFGTRITDFLAMSYFFTLNGYRVVRFDARNSVGLSSGNINKFSMKSLKDDIKTVVSYAYEKLSNKKPVILLALSLSSRAMLKFLASKSSKQMIETAISIAGVVNLRSTLRNILGNDVLAEGVEINDTEKILNFEIEKKTFFEYSKDFFSIKSSAADAKKINQVNFVAINCEKDEWINKVQQEFVYSNISKEKFQCYTIKNASHMIWKNNTHMQQALEKCLEIIKQSKVSKINTPEKSHLISKLKNEKRFIVNFKNNYEDYIPYQTI